MKSSDKTCLLEEEMATHSSILAMNSIKRQKDRTPEDALPRLKGVQYATGEVKVKVALLLSLLSSFSRVRLCATP